MSTNQIIIKDLSKVYDNGFEALKKINLNIKKGEIIALLGPNGAGKTTLISIICGIVNPSSGKVTVEDFDIIDDDEDWYKFSGAPNLLLTLSIEGLIFEENGLGYCCTTDGIDADLLIYDEDGNLTDFSYTSSSTSIYKQIVLPETGRPASLSSLKT